MSRLHMGHHEAMNQAVTSTHTARRRPLAVCVLLLLAWLCALYQWLPLLHSDSYARSAVTDQGSSLKPSNFVLEFVIVKDLV